MKKKRKGKEKWKNSLALAVCVLFQSIPPKNPDVNRIFIGFCEECRPTGKISAKNVVWNEFSRAFPSDPKNVVGRVFNCRVERLSSLVSRLRKIPCSCWECRVARHYPLPSPPRASLRFPWDNVVSHDILRRHLLRSLACVGHLF